MQTSPSVPSRRTLVGRYWSTARGFWLKESRVTAWLLTLGLFVLVLIQLGVQYRLNIWNRDVFNAIEKKDGEAALAQALIFLPLAAATVGLAVIAVYSRMTMQREWRAWLVKHLIGRWLAKGHYYQLNLIRGEALVPEGRMTDDARIASDPPVDFAVQIFSSVVTAATFIGVLWAVGGDITVGWSDFAVVIPGYLVIAAVIYSALISLGMVVITRRFISVSEATNQAEAEFRYALTRLRENGESIALLSGEQEERRGLLKGLGAVIERWRRYCHQHMRATVVSNSNWLLAPTIPLILCVPKYIGGAMTLGEVTQAAAAFVLVQSAFNWLVDNYPRLADWMASARRVGQLLLALDHLDATGKPGEVGAIKRSEEAGVALRLRDLTVRLDDGTVIINDADAAVGLNERVLLMGESGTGKSTLVRAIAGLWPWGEGEIAIRTGARMFLMPQRPYIPLGTLRRVVTYPLAPTEVPDDRIRKLMGRVGLGDLIKSLDEDAAWDHVLSGGEKQRIAFARLFLHRPNVIIMDEATSALDPASQAQMMNLLIDRLPDAAVVSIAHRPELDAFHNRKLVFEHRPGGSHLICDSLATPAEHAVALQPRPPNWRRPLRTVERWYPT
jgi:putative ATP-binding cassette transporter